MSILDRLQAATPKPQKEKDDEGDERLNELERLLQRDELYTGKKDKKEISQRQRRVMPNMQKL